MMKYFTMRPSPWWGQLLTFLVLLLPLTGWGQGVAPTPLSITTSGQAYPQDFDGNSGSSTPLANTGTSAALPAGFGFFESGSGNNTTYATGTGSGTGGDTYSFGTTAADRAFGGLLSGSLTPTIGAAYTNNTGSTITSLTISYTGEQWRYGATGRADRLDFQYSTTATGLGTGTYTDVNALDYTAPNTGTAGLRDGNAAANRTVGITSTITGLTIANGATFYIRWSDFNATGADDGLAVDDFSLTASTGAAAAPTIAVSETTAGSIPTGTGYAFANTAAGSSTPVSFTITNASADPLTIASIVSSNNALFAVSGAPTTVAGGATATFTVTFQPAVPGSFSSTLTITSNASNTPSYVINLTGTGTGVVANPEIDVLQAGTPYASGSTFSGFASTQQGSTSAPVSFTIQNTSADVLTISSINTTGNFAISGTAPTTVAANSSATVAVTFSPTATGTRTGTLVINSNDQDEATYTINLSGQGTTPPPTITALNPNTAVGGTTYTVTITGTNLGSVATTTVNFNGSAIVPTTVNGAGTSLTVALPLPITGTTYPITVTTATGTSGSLNLTVAASPAGFFEPFEPGTQAGYAAIATPATVALRTGSYTFVQALLGNTAGSDKFNNSQSARIRGGGFIAMNFDKPNGADAVTVSAALYGTDAAASFTLEYSIDGGANYVLVPGTPAVLTTTLTPYTYQLSVPGPIRLRIKTTNASVGNNPRINIDDLQITDYAGPSCVAPTAVAAGSVTTTTASISFTGSGTATGGYTVNYTDGVTPLTATGAASPIALSGLTPNTLYTVTVSSSCPGPTTATSSPAITFTTQAVAANPLIAVDQAGTPIANGGSFNFPNTAQGSTSAPVSFTITNASATDALTISSINTTGNFALSGTAPTTVAAGGTATFALTFTPTATGLRAGSVSINNDSQADNPYVIILSGQGIPPAPTITSTITSSLLAGIRSNIALTGTNLSGATVTLAAGGSAGAVTIGTVTTSATSASFTLVAAQAGTFTLEVTTAGGTATQAFTVTTPPAGFFEPFEEGSKPTSYATGNVTLTTGSWTFAEALLGSQAPSATPGSGDKKNQAQAVRLRTAGTATMNFDKAGGAGDITFLAALYGTDALAGATIIVELSTDGGTSFSAVGSPIVPTSTLTPYTVTANQSGNVRVRFRSTTTGTTPRIDVDDVQIADFAAPACVAPTAVAAGSVTTTTASISFTGSGTATGGYTVNYTDGVTPLTATGAASPIALSGLTPNTLYTVTVSSSCAGPLTATSTPAITFTTQAVAAPNPLIAVDQAGTPIANGGSFSGFPSTVQGSTSVPVSFTITNASATDALTISSINTTGNFALSGTAPTTVAAGGTATFALTFTPTATGTRNGTVSIANNSQTNNPYVINLSGQGIPPAPTITSTITSSLLAGIRSNIALTGTNLSGATVTLAAGGSAGAVTIGTVTTSATSASFTLVAAQAGTFTLEVTTAGGTATQAFTVTTPPAGFFEPFEEGSKPTSYATGNVTLTTGSWTFAEALLGSQAPSATPGSGDKKNQAQAVRLRTAGTATMNFDKAGGAGDITFLAALYGTDALAGATLIVELSTDGGTSFSAVGSPIVPTSTLTPYTVTANQSGNVRVRFRSTTTGTTPRINVDDVQITNFAGFPDLVVSTSAGIPGGTYNNITVQGPNGAASLLGSVVVNGAFVVQADGILTTDCTNTITGPGSFTLDAGGTLSICDAAGIVERGNTGAIQVDGPRLYSSAANYEYDGNAAQVTGTGLPSEVRSLRVDGSASGLTLTSPLSIVRELGLYTHLNTANQLTLLSNASGTAAISADGGTGSISGSTTVQRYITPNPNTGLGYRHYSSPVLNTTFGDLATPGFSPLMNTAYNTSATPGAITPFPNVYGYDETRVLTSPATGFTPFEKGWFVPTGTMELGRGYTVNIAANQVVDFVGTLNLADVNKTLTRQGGADGGWNLIGNPYAAPLDLSLITFPAGMNSAAYVYHSTSQYQGTFRAYINGVGGNPIVGVAQGFFVQATTNGAVFPMSLANTTLNFNPGEDNFYRGNASPKPLVQLTLRNAANTPGRRRVRVFRTGRYQRLRRSFRRREAAQHHGPEPGQRHHDESHGHQWPAFVGPRDCYCAPDRGCPGGRQLRAGSGSAG
jgi:hypothetical protein